MSGDVFQKGEEGAYEAGELGEAEILWASKGRSGGVLPERPGLRREAENGDV